MYSNPSIYEASINVVSIYVVKFFFFLTSISVVIRFTLPLFETNCDVNRGITVSLYNFFKFLIINILLGSKSNMKFDLCRLFFGTKIDQSINRGITVSSYNIFKFVVINILNMKFAFFLKPKPDQSIYQGITV